MSKNIIRSSKQNPCPVCNRTKDGDCRWYADEETVMCHTYPDGVGHNESSWHYNGLNDNPIWGNFVLKTEKEFIKAARPKSEKYYYYPNRDGNNLVRVTRKDDGSGKKNFYQHHWDGGKWVKGNPDEIKKLIPIYRYAEIRDAIERNEQVFVVEGEELADLLWKLGIAATTTIGGSGGYSKYGNYVEDFKGARLVLSPDRDTNGIKYISNFTRDFTSQIEGYCLAGSHGLWQNPQGGMDIGDEIVDYGRTKEQVIERVITPDKYKQLITKPSPPAPDKQVEGRKSKQVLNDDAKDQYERLAAILGMKIEYTDEGDIASRLNKLKMDLFEMFGDLLKLNLMTSDYELEGKQIDFNNAKSFISDKLGFDYSTENCILAIHSIASRHAYHPVDNYLESLRERVAPDFDVLNNIASLLLGNDDPLANKMMAKTFIGAVARVKKPGTKVDTLTVLQGGQGYLKSTFLKVLGGETWFCDDIRDLENKDELAKLARYWIVELAEVDYLMGRKEVESFKRFLSTTADTYRPPYGRANIRHDRTCCLFATTNKNEFLKDPTGSRRYWVVKVGGKIDCDIVAQLRDVIWATALAAYERGDTWWLDDCDEKAREERSEEFREPDAWEEIIANRWESLPVAEYKGCDRVEINRIFDLLDLDNDKRNKPNRNRIASILKLWGFDSKTINTEAGKLKAWLRPKVVEHISTEQPSNYLNYQTLDKHKFLGSSSDVITANNGVKLELNLELNTTCSQHTSLTQSHSQTGKELELNLELNSKEHQANLELNSPLDSNLELNSGSSLNPVSELVRPLLEPKNLRKGDFELGQKNNEKINRFDFKVGDRVRYVGSEPLLPIELNEILTVVEDCDEWIKCLNSGNSPRSVLSTDLEVA